MAAKEAARKEGINYAVGQVSPELEGYNGKVWNNRGAALDESGNTPSPWGTRAQSAGGPREQTRGMGNTTTQTERGYSNEVHAQGGLQASQTIPYQQGDLATGGQMQVATSGMDVEIPQGMWGKLGISGLKAGASTFIPFFGLVSNIGGRIYQKVHKDADPNTQSAVEMMMGYDPRYQGKLFRFGKKTWEPGQQAPSSGAQLDGR